MYKFSLPDSVATRTGNKVLLYAIKENRDWFYDDFVIDSVYGAPNLCIWNGGRVQNGGGWFLPPDSFFQTVVGMYQNKFGVSYRATFTNCLLEPVHFVDTYCNKLADLMNSVNAKVIVSLPMMAEYLRTRYKNLQICWSTSTNFGNTIEEQIDKINELSEQDFVVVPYWFNNKWDIIGQLKHREHIEFLANETCMDNCPVRMNHYKALSRVSLYEKTAENEKDFELPGCPMAKKFPDLFEKPKKHNIDRNMLYEYGTKQFNFFKLEGRNDYSEVNLLNRYLEYFLKIEHVKDMQSFYDECIQTNFLRFESH